MVAAYKWKPLEDLPNDWGGLASSELESLASIWRDQSANLGRSEALKQFNERLRREWAIETGVIEDLYSIDRGITQLLIERGLEESLIPHGAADKPASRVVPIIRDQEEVLEGLFDFVARRRELSTSYVKELHQALTRHQETVEAINGLGRLVEVRLLRGQWKQTPNNPTRPDGAIHEYCPPEHVASEMDRLIDMHKSHSEERIPVEVEAAWLHHRFTQVHPFQDGNGRIARALASLVFLRAEWFPLVIHRDNREVYIAALESGDRGDLLPLVSLFSRIEKKAFNRALSLSEDVLLEADPLRQVISAATSRLRERKLKKALDMQSKAFDLSNRLENFAEEKLQAVAATLSQELQSLDPSYRALTERNDDTNAFWFTYQIITAAKEMGYYADLRTYRKWVRLKIREVRQIEIVLSFHALGVTFLGAMAVSAFVEYRDRTEDGEAAVEGPRVLSDEVFQFSFRESEEQVAGRFRDWLTEVHIVGLDQRRRQI